MDAIILETVGSKIFKAQKLADGLINLKPSNLLEKPNKFILAAKSCDGTYHSVYSEISALIKKKKELIKKGIIGELINALNPNDNIHGRRFVIYQPKKNEAYLLGDVVEAFKKLAG